MIDEVITQLPSFHYPVTHACSYLLPSETFSSHSVAKAAKLLSAVAPVSTLPTQQHSRMHGYNDCMATIHATIRAYWRCEAPLRTSASSTELPARQVPSCIALRSVESHPGHRGGQHAGLFAA